MFFWLGVFTEWVGLLAYALISKWRPDLIRVVVQRGGGAGGRLAVTTMAGSWFKETAGAQFGFCVVSCSCLGRKLSQKGSSLAIATVLESKMCDKIIWP